MKKLLIFYEQLDKPLSGGQIIDFTFIEQIKESELFDISFFLDSDLKSTSIAYYNYYLISHIWSFLKYDVIFINSRCYPRMLFFVLLLRMLFFKGKIITYHHHYNFLVNTGIGKLLHRFFEVLFLKLMTTVIVPSPYTYHLTKKKLNPSRIKYIEIGFENDIRENKCNNPWKWLFVGTVEKRKGVEYLVEVAKILKDKGKEVKIDVVGSMSSIHSQYINYLKELIIKYGLEDNIKLLGRVDDELLKREYETSYGFIFPSLHEGYGMVLVEAMRYGLPIVTFNNSAMPYTVKDGYNGFVVENKNCEQMSDAILKLSEDNKIYAAFHKNAYDYVRDIQTQEEMKKEMRLFIRDLS